MIAATSPSARFCMLLVLILTLAPAALAQSQATTGNIEGRVLDPKEAAVPGATVTATNQLTGLEKTATTDDQGIFIVAFLPPGPYTVRANAGGFSQTEVRDVIVTVGGKAPLDVNLSVGGASGSVTISSEAPVVETTLSSVSTTVNSRAIENLPVNGRNYLDFATLTPGVIRDQNREGDLSVGGQKGTLNSLQVDGVDNNNTFFGQAFGRTGVRPPYQFSEESVQEFQVNQNGFSAEFGRAGGAVINVVTKSGTNEFHGGGFEFFRDESLNAQTPQLKASQFQRGFPNKRPPLQINQFGARLGGPIKRNKAFFFVTYDGQRQKLPNFLDPPAFFTQPASVQAPLLPKLNTYQINRNQDVLMVKSDISLTSKNQLSLRFNQQNFTGKNNEFTSSLGTEEHSGDSLAKTTTFSGALVSTISTSTVNEFRFQLAKDREPGEANSADPEAQIATGSGTFLLIGRNNFSPRETTIKRGQIIDNISFGMGRQNFKAGVDLNIDHIFNFFPGFFSGQFTFPSYASFAANTPTLFSQNFAGSGTTGATTNPNSKDLGLFFQDDLRVTPKLTLNLGLRYDKQFMAAPPVRNPDPGLIAAGLDTSRQPNDSNNFGPRTGFSYAFDDKTVVRGGYGIFYGRTTAIMLGTTHSNNGINILGVTLNCTLTPNPCPVYPNVFPAAPSAAANRPNLFLFSQNYQQPYVQQGRLGIERELKKNLSLSVTYLYFRGVHLSRTRDINLCPPVATPAVDSTGQTFTIQRFPGATTTPLPGCQPQPVLFTSTTPLRPFLQYNRIDLFEDSANSRYNGLAVQAKKRFSPSHWVPFFDGSGSQFLFSYTFSKAEDDKPDQTSVVPGGGDDSKVAQNPFDLRDEWSFSDADQRHRLVFSSVLEVGKVKSTNKLLRLLFNDYTLSGITQLQSGFAYSAQIGADINRDGNSRDDRVPGIARNSFRTPAVYQTDARITRTIRTSETTKLRLILEGFNIWNRANIGLAPGGGYFSFVNVNQYSSFTAVAATGTLTLTRPNAGVAFGLPRSIITPRQLQLAIKFDF